MKVTKRELMEAMENAKARLLREMDFGDDHLNNYAENNPEAAMNANPPYIVNDGERQIPAASLEQAQKIAKEVGGEIIATNH